MIAAPTVTSIAHDLRDAGIPMLLLWGPESVGGAPGFADKTIEILVPRDKRAATLRLLDGHTWRYQLGARGTWRALPAANFWWPSLNVTLYWGLPSLPFPSRALQRLERELWATARPHPDGYLEPEAEVLLLHLAFQAARPGLRYHSGDFGHFGACRGHVEDWERVDRVAAATRLGPALRGALAGTDAGADHVQWGRVFDGPLGLAWLAATRLQSQARPSAVRALLAGRLSLGDAPVRARIRGVEVLIGPRIFVPTPDADLFVDLATARIADAQRPIVIEVGTGSGAIALAIANAHAGATVHAADTSREGVRSAKRNGRRLGLDRVHFYCGSLLDPFPREQLAGSVSLILANLPFYPASDYAAIGAVPRDTIQGQDEDGLGLLRALARESRPLLEPGGALVMQMFDWQWERLAPELADLGYQPRDRLRSGPFAICPAELA